MTSFLSFVAVSFPGFTGTFRKSRSLLQEFNFDVHNTIPPFTTPYHHSQHYTTTILPQNHIICATLWSPVWTRWLDYFSNFGLFKLWTFVQHIANNSGQCRLKKLPYKHQNFFNLPKRQNLLKILSHWPQLQPKHQPLWSRFCN